MSNPEEDINTLHLEQYALNDFEPLHAIKGHLINLFAEIPFLLPHNLKQEVDKVLSLCLHKQKITGADLSAGTIVLCQLLANKGASKEIQALMCTIVHIAQVSYLPDSKRTPRTVLQLYNCTWYRHELLQHLIAQPHVVTWKKLFGSYLHDISCHACPQFETLSLRSCNTEFEERLFGQANKVAECCTNRQPENVLQQMFLRLQVILSQGTLKVKESKVARAAKALPQYAGTIIPKTFVSTWSAAGRFTCKGSPPSCLREKEFGGHKLRKTTSF